MHTSRTQRVIIGSIAALMIIGTVGSYIMTIMASENANKKSDDIQNQVAEQQKQQEKQADEMSAKYYPEFSQYKDAPQAFDEKMVGSTVENKDLKSGDGETIDKNSAYKAYYIGWNPRGVEFDSSFNGDKLKPPIDTAGIGLIPGWYEGVEGMKVGGVREITIPAAKAYGETGAGDKIPPNTPIKFIVMVISKDK